MTTGLLVAAPFSILIFATFLGVRPDVMTAMHNPFFDTKFAVTLSLAIPRSSSACICRAPKR